MNPVIQTLQWLFDNHPVWLWMVSIGIACWGWPSTIRVKPLS